MATLRDYFDLDNNNTVYISKKYTVQVHESKEDSDFGIFNFEFRAHLDFKTNAYYLSVYLEKTDLLNCPALAALSRVKEILDTKEDIELALSVKGENKMKTSDMIFTRRIFIYDENSEASVYDLEVQEQAKKNGHYLQIRRDDYVQLRNKIEKPYAFVSHDSRDKDIIAKPIVQGLTKNGCHVWYDEYSLNIGDSLRESIEKGIKEAKKCILILTPNFLKNPGWTKTEFNSIFTKDIINNSSSILPIWHNVSKEDVYEYSPKLLDTFALIWPSFDEENFDEKQNQIIEKIYKAIKY